MKDYNIHNPIVAKSKRFAIRIIRLYQFLQTEKHEFVMSRQLLRSGTSIGANIKEALRGQSNADFGMKMNIALKEASETEYWLELLFETDFILPSHYDSIIDDCEELLRMLSAIVKTTFDNLNRSK